MKKKLIFSGVTRFFIIKYLSRVYNVDKQTDLHVHDDIMVKLSVKNIRPGMILAKDVKDLNGRVLLPANQEVLLKHAKIFKKWGITQVFIVDDRKAVANDSPEKRRKENKYSFPIQVPEEKVQEAEDLCADLFKFNDTEQPLEKELFRIAVCYTVRNAPDIEGFDVV